MALGGGIPPGRTSSPNTAQLLRREWVRFLWRHAVGRSRTALGIPASYPTFSVKTGSGGRGASRAAITRNRYETHRAPLSKITALKLVATGAPKCCAIAP